MPREGRYYAAALVVASLVWLTPHLLHIRRVPDAGDPLFSAWRIARSRASAHARPAHLFDGNTFYPERYTLTYSDATLLEGLVGTPFIVAGVDALVVSNVIFLAAFPICGLAFFYTGWRLTADLRAAFVSGLLGALYPFHLEHYSHLELQYFCFVPLATLALLQAASPRLIGVAASCSVRCWRCSGSRACISASCCRCSWFQSRSSPSSRGA